MQFRSDMDAVEAGVICLLAFHVGADQTAVLGQLHWFEDRDAADKVVGRTLAWRDTYTGSRLPADWKPYAYAIVQLPDPALLEEEY